MNTLQMSLSKFGLKPEQVLSRTDMKKIVGGQEEVPEDGSKGPCLGCTSDSDCKNVGKGTCDNCTNHGKKCCSGWHSDY
ncbi:MAG: hypothetical protein ACN4EP_15990 [Sediminibacterium sp.]